MARKILLTDEEISLLEVIGLTTGLQAVANIVKRATQEMTEEEINLIQEARDCYQSDDIRVDQDAEISPSEDGAFVSAWVWMPK